VIVGAPLPRVYHSGASVVRVPIGAAETCPTDTTRFIRSFVIVLISRAIPVRLLAPADFRLPAIVAEPANTLGGFRRMIIGVTAP